MSGRNQQARGQQQVAIASAMVPCGLDKDLGSFFEFPKGHGQSSRSGASGYATMLRE